MIHQPYRRSRRHKLLTFQLQAKEIIFIKSSPERNLAECTGQTVEGQNDSERDFYMSPQEAKNTA